ncbi:tRNA preQ1(34) S-adenosylmethionine ribosyltransferase-isomerase QueA [Spirochaetia bacterium 38H-sp]|uniref:S-adenosylmethionine:tRNA ribosyltransferase-isomerase n=1 Tax=Rarispira pelagica TaxID=3141764 RepID=A0ABU9UAU7_9SPIR
MKTKDFFFNLPEDLIAQYPSQKREQSRLMVLYKKTGQIEHSLVENLPSYVSDACIVFNDTRVRKARIIAEKKQTGAKVEFLFIEKINDFLWKAITSKSKKQKPGDWYYLPGGITVKIDSDCENGEKIVRFSTSVDDDYFDKYGHVPLPPYIKREDDFRDFERYQTVFAKNTGSVAAPTAGLHFSDELLQALNTNNHIVYVTLHVGLGTFLPVRTENVEEHHMHEEAFFVSDESASIINQARASGKKICAIGTTSVRTLESSYDNSVDRIVSKYGKTNLFIYPGYNFNVVDIMFTNFHTPGSSLLMLVSAFAGTELIKEAYRIAIEKKYRFFSYGDAMLIL